jgi:hypothetical protein
MVFLWFKDRSGMGPGAWAAGRWALGLWIAASTALADAPAHKPALDMALMTELLQWAGRLSGLPVAPALPELHALAAADLAQRVCPQRPGDCRTLVAVYDTDQRMVLYRDSLDLRDETDQSYIVHELVHYLQHLRDGDRLFANCEQVMAAETLAYGAQNKYLAHFKQWRRVGEMLRFTHCQQADADPEYRPDQPAALAGRSPQGR